MKVFRAQHNSNLVPHLLPTNSAYYDFDCKPKKNLWTPYNVYNADPIKKARNFYSIYTYGVLVFDDKALDICQTVFEMSGEILPIQVERGPKLYLLNVLQCMNGLDYNRTKWDYYDDGTKGRILEYKFHENRIVNESTIFKIPETCATSIFCFTDERDEDDQFYHLYHKHKLTGLIFEEIDNS